MITRSSPEIECLELRQLPHSSLAAAGLSSVHQPPEQQAATEDPSQPVVPPNGSEGDLGQRQPETATDSRLGHSPALAAAIWPTPPLVGNGPLGQATDQSSSSNPSDILSSLPDQKGDSVGSNNAQKLVDLSEHDSASESLANQVATANSSITKQPERLVRSGQGRSASDELSFREESGVLVNAKQREQSLPAAHSHLSSEAASPAAKRGRRLASGPRKEHSFKELEHVFSFFAYDLPQGALSFSLVEGSSLIAKRVEKYFSSAGYGPSYTLLPGREGGPLNSRPMAELLDNLWDVLPGPGSSLLRTKRPDDGQRGESLCVPPLYLSVVLYRQSGKPLDPSAQQGLERLCAYAWSSIRNAERAHGEKFLSPEDVVQEIYLEWRGLVGPQAEDGALSRLLQDGSEEMKFLRTAVTRVIGRTRYQQRQWTKTVDVNKPADQSAAFAQRGEQERIDWEDLWENVVSTLGPQEKQILEMRKQGKTFAEIGSSLGMPRQRACETYHGVVARLQKNYPDW